MNLRQYILDKGALADKESKEWPEGTVQRSEHVGKADAYLDCSEHYNDFIQKLIPHLIWPGKGNRWHCRLCEALCYGPDRSTFVHKDWCVLK